MTIALSVLDLAPICAGGTAADALANSADLARQAERLGYTRYWLAEHHNTTGIASAATSIAICHVAANTQTIRVGAGGIMLPNHAPLVVAEQFGTLETLFPGRIDLGLGRAPGTDALTMRALRRTLMSGPDDFPRDVAELLAYFRPVQEGQKVQAVPGAGLNVPVWILGSSLYGAQLAAAMGLPYAFASHFAPAQLMEAIDIYRRTFRPSEYLEEPYVMAGLNVFAAETEDEARFIMSSMQQAFIALRTGHPGPLPAPVENLASRLSPQEMDIFNHTLSCSVVGDPGEVKEGIEAFVDRTGVDELIIANMIYDHGKRVRSLELTAEAAGLTAA